MTEVICAYVNMKTPCSCGCLVSSCLVSSRAEVQPSSIISSPIWFAFPLVPFLPLFSFPSSRLFLIQASSLKGKLKAASSCLLGGGRSCCDRSSSAAGWGAATSVYLLVSRWLHGIVLSCLVFSLLTGVFYLGVVCGDTAPCSFLSRIYFTLACLISFFCISDSAVQGDEWLKSQPATCSPRTGRQQQGQQ